MATSCGVAAQLGLDRLDDFRIAVAGSVDSVPPEAIDEPGAVHISEGLFRVLPLDEGGVRGYGLAIQQPARIDVLIEVVHRVVDDAFLFFLVEFGLQDVVQHPARLVEYLFLAATHGSPPSIESKMPCSSTSTTSCPGPWRPFSLSCRKVYYRV
jgi:hypothetical protein